MSKIKKVLDKILYGFSDSNIDFDDLCYVLRSLEFDERIKGSHHIYSRSDVAEIINIQPKGSKAKPYQVKQVRHIIITYRLGDVDE